MHMLLCFLCQVPKQQNLNNYLNTPLIFLQWNAILNVMTSSKVTNCSLNSRGQHHTSTLMTDLNLNAISQVDSNQVVTLHSRVRLLQDFNVSLRVSEIQIT